MWGNWELVVVLRTLVAAWVTSWWPQYRDGGSKEVLFYVPMSSVIWLGQGHMLVGS